MKVKTAIQSTRLPFLVLTPVCIFLGLSTVIAAGVSVNWKLLAVALAGGLFAHISVNALNEYLDYKSGLDLQTERTAFSGGSGALPSYPAASNAVLFVAMAALGLLVIIGLFFIWLRGWQMLMIGLPGILLITTYTQWINKNPFVCLLAPGLGFGLLMVCGLHVVLTGYLSELALLVSWVPFFLVNNLLLLNQYPDIEADKKTGRFHFPIAYGVEASTWIYALFNVAALAVILLGVVVAILPLQSLIALLPTPLAVTSFYGARKYNLTIGAHPHYLALNVMLTLLVPLLLGLSLVFWGGC